MAKAGKQLARSGLAQGSRRAARYWNGRVISDVVNRQPPLRFHPSTKLRKWAKEARMIARTFRGANARARMLAIAAEYDRMAERAEQRPADSRSV